MKYNAGGQSVDHKNHGFPNISRTACHGDLGSGPELPKNSVFFSPQSTVSGRVGRSPQKCVFCPEAGATFLFTWRIMKTVEQEFGMGLDWIVVDEVNKSHGKSGKKVPLPKTSKNKIQKFSRKTCWLARSPIAAIALRTIWES